MPPFKVILPYDPIYKSIPVFDPTTLEVPNDVDTIGAPINLPGSDEIFYKGKLKKPVTARFSRDGSEIVFPINSRVSIIENKDGTPKFIALLTDKDRRPVLAHVPAPAPAGGAGGQGGGRRRGSTRRRVSRHHSTGRRRRSGTRRHRRS